MRVDAKLVAVVVMAMMFFVHIESWGRFRVRVRVPFVRRIARVVRKAGNGIKKVGEKAGKGLKNAAEETGKGLKKAAEETGKGLKKAAEETGKGLKKAAEETGKGLKKAGEVTGKHLYKGLKETGKALIKASNFVGEILNKINLMKFIWEKLGACCIPIPSLCKAKRKFNSAKRSLKYFNTAIDKKWTQVETLFGWLGRNNVNVEDLSYHVDRITSGAEETLEAIAPGTFIQYNNKMNTIKQDIKWKNSSVIHLTRQAVTTFVDIEMAWQCPKVAKSVKSGLRVLEKAKARCVDMTRESNDLLRFMTKGWNHIKRQLTSAKLKSRLIQIKALCLDSQHTFCVSAIENFLKKIGTADYGKTFELQEDLISALAATKYTYSCLKRKEKVLTTVSEYCQQGNEDFHSVFLQAIIDFFPNSDICTGLVTKDYTTKEHVLKQLQIESSKKGFYSSCSLNNREVKTRTCLNYTTTAKTFQLPPVEESRLLEDCKKIVPSLGQIYCKAGLCKNGGTCLEKRNSFTCSCPHGFKGTKCEIISGTSGVNYETLGCFQDRRARAIPVVEGRDPLITGHHKSRKNAIENCYKFAKKNGFQVFALQDGGHCGTGASAEKTFNKYGISRACKRDGKGGPWANQVYYIKDYIDIGCYTDNGNRAIQPIEGKDSVLDGSYLARKNAIPKCAVAARRAGFTMFALQHGGWCAASDSAPNDYKKYGKSSRCQVDGEGGPWANEVYILKAPTFPYETIGCYQDHASRAIPPKDSIILGHYKTRPNAIEKCYEVAKNRGYKVFAVQDGGWCATSRSALKTFNKYGGSSACKPDGKGGPWANQVYYIKDYRPVGCYKDAGDRAIATMEKTDPILDGYYRFRKNAIAKCAAAAKKAGFRMFAVQHGGWCAASATAPSTFSKYGKSPACKPDGKGGPWANEVYLLH